MEQRIKAIRKAQKLTQTEFGQRIGVKGNTVTNYETGLRMPSEAVIRSICREFKVSERWLRTGEGEMRVKLSAGEEVAAFVGDVLSREEEDFRLHYLCSLARLTEEEWALLERMVTGMGEMGKKKPAQEGR